MQFQNKGFLIKFHKTSCNNIIINTSCCDGKLFFNKLALVIQQQEYCRSGYNVKSELTNNVNERNIGILYHRTKH